MPAPNGSTSQSGILLCQLILAIWLNFFRPPPGWKPKKWERRESDASVQGVQAPEAIEAMRAQVVASMRQAQAVGLPAAGATAPVPAVDPVPLAIPAVLPSNTAAAPAVSSDGTDNAAPAF